MYDEFHLWDTRKSLWKARWRQQSPVIISAWMPACIFEKHFQSAGVQRTDFDKVNCRDSDCHTVVQLSSAVLRFQHACTHKSSDKSTTRTRHKLDSKSVSWQREKASKSIYCGGFRLNGSFNLAELSSWIVLYKILSLKISWNISGI